MNIGKKKWKKDFKIKIIKAYQIQRHWRNYSSNPEYKLAQRLICNRIM